MHDTAANGSTPLHWAAGSGHVDVEAAAKCGLRDAHALVDVALDRPRQRFRPDARSLGRRSGHTQALEALLSHDPHALLMEDERQLQPAAVAARDGHPWLQEALGKLEREPVVCVRVGGGDDAEGARRFGGCRSGARTSARVWRLEGSERAAAAAVVLYIYNSKEYTHGTRGRHVGHLTRDPLGTILKNSLNSLD